VQINFSTVTGNLARTFGSAEAIVNVERNRRYTYEEYHRLTNRIVNMMREKLGLRRGDVWLTILHNDSLTLLHWITAMKGEACAAYTNSVDTVEEQVRQLELVRPKVVFIEEELLPTHYAMLRERGVAIVSMDPPPTPLPGVQCFWDLMEGVPDDNPDVVHDDRKDCVVLRFTGGTTGIRKGVMYCVDNFMANKDLHFAMADSIPSPGFRFLHMAPISHASGMGFLPVMFRGGCTVTMNQRNLVSWCKTVERERANASLLVPSLLYALLQLPEAASADLSSLQIVYYGASPMSPAKLVQLRERFGNIFVQMYGSSEHPAVVTSLSRADHLPLEGGDQAHFASAGRIVPGVELRILDRKGQPVPPGVEGEIWLRSRATCLGYLDNPVKTAEEFRDGFWISGDVGRMDARGFVYVVDRVKDTIESQFANVYPTEVEAAISAHPDVMTCAVVGIPRPDGGEEVHAEVVLREGAAADAESLCAFLRDKLPPFKMPTSFGFAAQLPMSSVGKVLRRAVREACLGRRAGADAAVPRDRAQP